MQIILIHKTSLAFNASFGKFTWCLTQQLNSFLRTVLFIFLYYKGTDFPTKDLFRASVEQSKDSLSAGNKSLFVEVTTTFMPIASQF